VISEQLPELSQTGFARDEVYGLAYPFNEANVVCGLFALAEKIAPQALAYDLLVGEDTSGRLAAHVMRNLINQRRRAEGMEPVQTRFANARTKIADHLRCVPPPVDSSRTLVVTEYAYRGNTVLGLCDDLKVARPGVPIDVGAVTSTERATRAFSRDELPAGSRMFATLAIDTQLVEKSENPWPSRPAKGVLPIEVDPFVIKTINFDSNAFLAARQSAAYLATRFNAQIG
jgi:hypothetical protein